MTTSPLFIRHQLILDKSTAYSFDLAQPSTTNHMIFTFLHWDGGRWGIAAARHRLVRWS